jgi:DNA-binding SARP family transcriptional activator
MRIRLTGRVGIEGEAGDVSGLELPGRQGRIALAYLALHHRPVSRDELADVIWEQDLPHSWERDLSAVISKLKPLLARVGAQRALEGAMGCYELRLPPGSTVDVIEARRFAELAELELRAGRLSEALGAACATDHIARRSFLPGDSGAWVDARRDELRELTCRGYLIEAQCYRLTGNLLEALRYARMAVELDPDREAAYAELMRAHLAAGERALALRVYEHCRSRLLDELGVPPGPEVLAAHRDALGMEA